MSNYGAVKINSAASLITKVVQSAEAPDLQDKVTAAIAAIPATHAVIGITLAGAGDGHTFTVTIEAGKITDLISGGFTAAPPTVSCYLASDAEQLAIVEATATPTSGIVSDVQVAGSSKGTRFMGLITQGAISTGGIEDHKVIVDMADGTPDFLFPKLKAGPGITLAVVGPVANEQVEISAPSTEDHKVLVDGADTTPDFLFPKLVAGTGIVLAVVGAGNEQVKISAPSTEDHKVLVDGADTTPDFLFPKLVAGTGIVLAVVGAGNEQVEIKSTDKTYYADNGSMDIAIPLAPPGTAVTVVSVPGVVVAAGQKLIIHASAYFSAITGGTGPIFFAVFASSGGPDVPIDGVGQTATAGAQEVITRVFADLAPAAGTYTIKIKANVAAGLTGATVVGTPPGTGLFPGGRLTVQVLGA
jgi:hypothetical protein